MYYTSFDKLTHPSVDPVQRTISLLQNYSVDDGDPTDIIYESFTLLTKGGSTALLLDVCIKNGSCPCLMTCTTLCQQVYLKSCNSTSLQLLALTTCVLT